MNGPFASNFVDPQGRTGRRAAARLRLSIPARLITLYETQRCVLLDLSRSGARIGLPRPLGEGDAGFLQFSDFEMFASVQRREPGINGLEFDIPMSDADVLAVREYAESTDFDERLALRNDVRAWVTGLY